MRDYWLAHLSDAVLLRDLAELVTRERLTTASLLAHIAEVDARRLYVPAGYPSMFAYCVEELRLSEDAAAKRIQAARAARRFPALFVALAEGRLHLTAVGLLAPQLTPENAGELIEAATHRKKSEIEVWLARRFGVPEPRTVVRAISAVPSMHPQHAPAHSRLAAPALMMGTLLQHAPAHVGDDAPEAAISAPEERAPAHDDTPKPEPPPERYLVQVTIEKSTHDKLRQAQALLSHAVPGGNVAQVLDRALDALIAQLEKRKFGAVTRDLAAQATRGRPHGIAASFTPSDLPQALHPRTDPSRGLGARRGPVHLRRREWEALRDKEIPRVRPHRARGPWWPGDRSWTAASVPRAQPV